MQDSAIDYLEAAAAYALFARPEDEDFFSSIDDMVIHIRSMFNYDVKFDLVEHVAQRLAARGLFLLDYDKYAGTTVKGNQKQYDAAFRSLREGEPNSLITKGYNGSPDFFDKVFANPNFRADLEATSLEDLGGGVDTSLVPASDRIVTLLHNSPEGQQIRKSLDEIEQDLDTNNEVAQEAGEDRERLLSEIKAAKSVIWSDRIRVDVMKSLVLKVLKELATKVKSKAMDWGLDHIISLLDKLIDSL